MNPNKTTHIPTLIIVTIVIFLTVTVKANTYYKDISFRQELAVPQNASIGDNCGKIYALFTYKPENSLTFSISGGNTQLFNIESNTGEIYVNQALTNGDKTIYITIEDGSLYYDIDTVTIHVIPTSKCIFVDPSYSGESDGSKSRPFSNWDRQVESIIQKGYAYFQKRGTVYSGVGLDVYNDGTSEKDKVIIGAYGKGERPVIDGSVSHPDDASIAIGIWDTPASYVEIYSFVIRNSDGIESTPGSNHFKISNCEVYNCGNNACVYLRNDYDDSSKKLNIELKNLICYNSASHGIKLQASGCYAINCKTYNNGVTGFKFALESSYNHAEHIYSYGNSSNGITLDGNYCSLRNSITFDNSLVGIKFTATSTNTTVTNCTASDNQVGLVLTSEANEHIIKNCSFYDNIGGLKITEGVYNCTIYGCKLFNNDEYGIRIDISGEVVTPPTNIYVNYNLIYNNKEEEIFLHGAKNIYFNNNTIFPNNFAITQREENQNIRLTNNILRKVVGTYISSKNLFIENTNIFVDYTSHDFHLLPNASAAIDKGASVDLSEDIEGNSVPAGSAPDIGCYEFYSDNSQFEPPEAPSNLSGTALSYKSIRLNWSDNSKWESTFIVQRSTSGGAFVQIASLSANTRTFTDFNLVEQTSYRYRVFARNPYGTSSYSNIVQVTTLENLTDIPPQNPSNLTARSVNEGNVSLAWTDNSNVEDHFVIQRALGTGSFTNIGETSTNIPVFNDTQVEAGSSYRYRVYAYNNFGNSGYSNIITVNIPGNNQNTPPIAPTNVLVTDIDYDFVELIWIDNANNEDEYIIQRSYDSLEFVDLKVLDADTNRYIDDSVTNGHTYYYRLFARNEFGSSPYSEIIRVDVPMNSSNVPSAPTNLGLDYIGIESVSFVWTDNSFNETGFYIYKKRNDETSFTICDTLSANQIYYIDNQVDYKATYIYKVRAYNEFGVSEYSNSIAALIIPNPVVPTNLTAKTLNYNTIQLTWKDNDEYEDYYQIERKTSKDDDFIALVLVMKDSTTYIDNNLQVSETYQYRVRSRNKAGLSEPSNAVEITLQPFFISKREREGIIAEYLFEDSNSDIVKDISGFSYPLDLIINDENGHSKGLPYEPNSDTRVSLQSITSAEKIINECKKTNEITVECWIKSNVNDFLSESTILAIGKNMDTLGFLLGQRMTDFINSKYSYFSQTATAATVPKGYPKLLVDADFDFSTIHHLVYTRNSDGNEYLYLNGFLLAQSFRPEGFETWQNNYMLSVANNLELDSKWNGHIYYMAIFNTYKDEETIKYNYSIGPSDKIIDVNKVIKYELQTSPNPTRSDVNISIKPLESNEFSSRLVLTVSDVTGDEIYHDVINNPSEEYHENIDLSGYKSGLYFVTLIQDEQIIETSKLILLN